MAKGSGSKGSRSERRAGRERAERAKERGLPVRSSSPTRRPQPSAGAVGASSAASEAESSLAAEPSRGVPTLVKVIAAALVILLGVYLLSRQRDAALTETPASPHSFSK